MRSIKPCKRGAKAPSQVVSHLAWGELIWGEAQEGGEQHSQIVIGKPLRQKPKSNEGAEQGLDMRIGETQSRDPLAGNSLRLVDLLKGIFSQAAIVAEGLDVQKTSVGLKADLSQGGQVLQPFADVKVTGVVAGGFGGERAAALVGLLGGG